VRLLLEIYRWVTLAAFICSAALILLRLILPFILPMAAPGVELRGIGIFGIAALAVTFTASGFNVIMIAIYDQLRALTTEAERARTEIAYLREELRGRG